MTKIEDLVLINISENDIYFITKTGELWRKYPIVWNGRKIQKSIKGKLEQISVENSEKIFKKIKCLLDLKNDCYYKQMKWGEIGTGHKNTTLTINGNKKVVLAHRLVAEHFIPNPQKLPVVNHMDCNPRNNNYKNLEWCTIKHNVHHAIENGLLNWEHKKIAILQYDHEGNFIQEFDSAVQAEEQTGALRSVICRALDKNKLAKGCIWRTKKGKITKKIKGLKAPKFWKRKVLMYDLQGNFIEEFDSATDVTKKYGINNVRAVLRGTRNKAGGYTFKYKNEI